MSRAGVCIKVAIKVISTIAVWVLGIVVILLLCIPLYITIGNKYSLNIVSQNSMYPTIKSEDILLMEDCSFDDVNIGDIILYYKEINGETVGITHRAVRKIVCIEGSNEEISKKDILNGVRGADGIVTKGDNNAEEDIWTVLDGEVHGKMVVNIGNKTKCLLIWQWFTAMCIVILAIARKKKKR